MNRFLSGKALRSAVAAAAMSTLFAGGAAFAAVEPGQPVSEADLAARLGPATPVVLIEATALREQPRKAVRPGLSVPSGVQVRAYQRIYNEDGHWSFIRVDDALGWVPSSVLN